MVYSNRTGEKMRVDTARLSDLIRQAENGHRDVGLASLVDDLALDLRDTMEAVKILQGISNSQAEALDMMEKGQI